MHGETMSEQSKAPVLGCYANYLIVGHNAFEFVLELGQQYEGSGDPRFITRIVTAPVYAKAMLETLRASIEQFESLYGSIDETGVQS